MSSHFIITRVSSPSFDSANLPESRRELGDQFDFGWALPSVYRALANPLNLVALPKRADKQKDWSGAVAYWHCLQHLMAYRLGWRNPAQGIENLFSEPATAEMLNDDTTNLINQVWVQDGYLRYYVEWAYRRSQTFHNREWTSSGSFEMEDETEGYRRHSPVGLHLEWRNGGHYFNGRDQPDLEPAQVVKFDAGTRSATILVESAWGWFEALSRAGEKLRELGGANVSIDVFVKSIGFMGTFGYSDRTELWFTCSNEIHMMGN